MNTSERSRFLWFLRGRRDAIASGWYEAIAHTGFASLTATEMRRYLGELTDRAITVLLSEPFERREARAIGSALAGTHYLSPETLSGAQEALARRLVEGLPADQAAMLRPRVAMLLAETAAGFFERACSTILLEQEQVKAALVGERKRVEEALRESEAGLAQAQRIAHLGHWDYEWSHDRLRWSDEIYRIFGLSKQEFGGTFEDYFKRVHPDDRKLVEKAGEEALSGEMASLDHRVVRSDGEVRFVQHRLQYLFDDAYIPLEGHTGGPDDEGDDESKEFLDRIMPRAANRHPGQPAGRPVRAVGTIQDITERKLAEEALREAEERFRSAFENAPIGMALLSLDRRYLRVNRSLCEMLGYSGEELLARHSPEITHPEDLEISRAYVDRILEDGDHENYDLEKRYVHAGGHVVWALLNVSLVRDSQGDPSHFVAQYQDITERKALEERLKHQAFHDPLTDLPNRALFLDRLEHTLARMGRGEGPIAVLFLDLDNFKLVNDGFGHAVGDQLLLKVAGRLEACLRPQDTVARFGGDEFTILLEDAPGLDSAILVAKRVIEGLQAPFVLKGREVFVTASIGIVLSSPGRENFSEDLLRDADAAMYRAKAGGKAGYEVFEPNMNVRALEQLELESDLRRAIEREEFVVHYQPVVELATGKVVGMEALLRWEHPERGLLYPSGFIPLTEETGLIVPIGQYVIEEVCNQARLWQEQYLRDPALVVSVNLSARQFQHPGLIQELAQALRKSGADPNGLELEITESVLMKDEEVAPARLEELKGLGIRMALDDFGTSYSSLSYLKRLPVETLKLDKSFVDGLGKDPKDKLIASATISLAQTLGLEVVAEGVETAEQLRQLRKLGCDLVQGNYFARPLTSEEASALIATGPRLKLR